MPRPTIFISAISKERKSTRQPDFNTLQFVPLALWAVPAKPAMAVKGQAAA